MIRRSLVNLLVAVFVLAPAAEALAQQADNPFQDSPEFNLSKDTPASRVAVARKLIRAKNYRGAADLLEVVYETDSANMTVVNLLKICYNQLKQYDRAEVLMRRALERDPASLGHRLSLAEFLAKQGRSEPALQQYAVITKSTPVADVSRQLLLIRSMLSVGLDSAALAYIDANRIASGNDLAFGVERGTILEGELRYQDAAREYLNLLNSDSTREAARSEKRLMGLLEFEESSRQIETLLLTFADSANGLHTLMLLADYYTKSEHYDQAFDLALRCDSITGFSGFPLIDFLRQCRERKAWEQVARMGSHITGRPIDDNLKSETEFAYAAALVHLGRTDEAIAAYDRVVASNDHPQVIADALFGIATVYLDHVGDYAAALTYFDSIVTHYPRGLPYLNARRSIPHCYLRSGDLERAAEGFAALEGENLPDQTREEAVYFGGLIRFFKKQYDSAALAMNRLLVSFPRGFYVNDALSLSVLMSKVKGTQAYLDGFSEALFFQQQGLIDSTRSRLSEVAALPGHVLADVALFELAELELTEADTAAALTAAERLMREFPDSYYLPFGMKIKADLYRDSAETREQAAALYRQILESYPDYPFATEVRERLRELQTVLSVG